MTQPLYKDQNQGVLFGVCAGLAHYFNVNVLFIRGAFLLPFLPMWIAYVILALVLEERPSPESLAQSVDNLTQTLDKVQAQLQDIEHAVVRLEAYVTSDAFEFQRKLWDLEKTC